MKKISYSLTYKSQFYYNITMNKHELSQIDMERLRYEIKGMNQRKELYRVLKEELLARGYWKARKRGNPALGYKMRGKKKNVLFRK